MYCPNCGANNKKHQNYCRYCGLHLPDIEKLFLNQLVFGEETKQQKSLRTVGKFVEYIALLLFISTIVGVFIWFYYGDVAGRNLLRFALVSYFSVLAIRKIVGHLERRSLKNNKRRVASSDAEQFEVRKTDKLIEEKPFSPIPSVTENSTELLFAEGTSRKAE